ncbi:hypothetical protein NPIL_396571 [Nephila pilipes]|uniref:Uncharacterized protein n=1 Tax=Nephila pilipes TaxID=299642 RepID=A0A8X6N0R0_NEPPI|nr:hypothetical protein NPIL_396571 [Nephila pilipes]
MPLAPSLHSSAAGLERLMVGDCVTSAANLMCHRCPALAPWSACRRLVASPASYQQQRTSSVSRPNGVPSRTPPMSTAADGCSIGQPSLSSGTYRPTLGMLLHETMHHRAVTWGLPRLSGPAPHILPPWYHHGRHCCVTAGLIDYKCKSSRVPSQ